MTIRIAALTEGLYVPSARFRVRQYIPLLRGGGIEVKEFYSRVGKYPPPQRWARPLWALRVLAERAPRVLETHQFDAVLLQRELVSSFLTLERFTKKPRILDVDDAIFVHRRGHFARRLARICERVICGNSFLAEWFAKINPNVTTIPTAVDTERFIPSQTTGRRSNNKVIGWIGTGVNLKYLHAVESALAKVLRMCPDVRLRIISDQAPSFRQIDPARIEFVRWSEQGEVTGIQDSDIGVMPLEDSVWARGKCSYKMLQYMACGLPVVVSPIGMNADILRMANIGFAASTEQQWVDALITLIYDENLAHSLGRRGREVVEESFALRVVGPRLAEVLRGR